MRKAAIVLASIILGWATSGAIGAIRDAFPRTAGVGLDLLLLPGAFLGLIVAPGGVHGGRVNIWIASVLIGNALFYGALWFLLLRILLRKTLRSSGERSSTPRA